MKRLNDDIAFWHWARARQAKSGVSAWAKETAYEIGNMVRYDGQVYTCIEAHTSVDEETPDIKTDLWSV